MIPKTVLFLVASIFMICADSFEKGNTFYQESQFDSAFASYSQALKELGPSATLYYNLGNCSYRLGNIGEAILYYEKAKRLAPTDTEILKNLEFMQTQTIDEMPKAIANPLTTFFSILHTLIPLKGQLWLLFLGSLLFTFFLWIILFQKENRRNWAIYGASATFLILVIIATSAGTKINTLENQKYGIILTEKVDAMSEPEGTKKLFSIHEGTKCMVRRESNNWLLIGLANGVSGWVSKDSVGIVE